MTGSGGFSGAADTTAGIGGTTDAGGQGGTAAVLGPDLYLSPDGDDANPGRTVDSKTILFNSNYGTGTAPPSSGCVVSSYTQISGTVTDWPQAATDIANAAGVEEAFKELLTKVPATPPYDYLK
jgi:hypothetical protein